MNRLPIAKRVAVVSALVEGNSLRATCRMTGVAMNTVLKLLADVGTAAVKLHDERVVGLDSKRLQLDEIWQFCYSKEKNVPKEKKGQFGYGDVWTWTAIDADSKMIVSYLIGPRSTTVALSLLEDLKSRVTTACPQITTDGLRGYRFAVDQTYGIDVDFAQVQKNYYGTNDAGKTGGVRYSPSSLTSVTKEVIRGNPDPKHISTSYVERQTCGASKNY